MSKNLLCKAIMVGGSKWIEGYYYKAYSFKNEEPYIVHYIYNCDEAKSYPVVEDTVCQYIGITDINDKKIFESDVIRHYNDVQNNSEYEQGTVFWDENKCMFLRASSVVGCAQLWKGNKYEVVGNIHDNILNNQ